MIGQLRRILVTGGAGFIGGHLVRQLLAEGHLVTVLDDLSSGREDNIPKGADFIVGTILDQKTVNNAIKDADACVHLAAIASVPKCNEELVSSHKVNSTGFLTIVEAARASSKSFPILYASSAAVYGSNQALPLCETTPASPISPYGADKMSCELHARAAYEVYGIPSIGFRFFNVYGPGQDPKSPYSGVITKFTERARRGEAIFIHGDGNQTRDFVFVGDIVACLSAALKSHVAEAKVLNVCTGTGTSVNELAALILSIVGPNSRIEHTRAFAGEVKHSVGNPQALVAHLGVGANTNLKAGLRQFLS